MNNSEGHLSKPRRQVLPSFSTRTLHHPSFMPLYVTAGFPHHCRNLNGQTVDPITPSEFFYTDPTLSRGRRIPNIVSDLGVFDCLQLNTPPPMMSACVAPPTRPDPFRSASHPTRDLGSANWKMSSFYSQVQQNQAVVQLTLEEDQAITNLLKLRHQELRQSEETLIVAQMDFSSAAETPAELNPTLCLSKQQRQEQGYSNMELEVADTLLSCFNLMEEDRIWCHQKSAVKHPDPPQYQRNEDLAISTETQQETETLLALKASPTQSDGVTFDNDNGEPGGEGFRSIEDRRISGDSSEVRERMLSDLEGDAVHVLLSIGDMGPLDILQ